MIDSFRDVLTQQQRLPALAALLVSIGLLALQYYLFRSGRRTRGMAKDIEVEIEPWLRQIREKHFGESFKPKVEPNEKK